MGGLALAPYREDDDDLLIRLITGVRWNERQIQGQLTAIHRLAGDSNGKVIVTGEDEGLVGYIVAEFHEWNRLGQIQGLVVHPDHRRRGIASRLVSEVEDFMKEKGARGIYVDTPVTNEGGRRFYEAIGYAEDYIMTEYSDEGQDGVTYLKLFQYSRLTRNDGPATKR